MSGFQRKPAIKASLTESSVIQSPPMLVLLVTFLKARQKFTDPPKDQPGKSDL